MDVRRTVETLGRHWRLIITGLVLGAALGGAVAMTIAPTYTATAQALVSIASPETRSPTVLASGSQYIQQRMTSYAELVRTSRVLDTVINTNTFPLTSQKLSEQVAAHSTVETALIDISAAGDDPSSVAQLADAVAQELATTIQELENGTVRVTLSAPAAVPTEPSNRRVPITVGVAAAGGLLAAASLALLLDQRRGLRRHRHEVGDEATRGPAGGADP
jgi:capsular polysaccharide biosynthesis protein